MKAVATLKTGLVTDKEFLTAIFGKDTPWCHVTDFAFDPSNIPKDKHLIAWKGDYFSRYQFSPNTNRYFTISTFYCDDQQQARRRKALYRQTHCLVLDDVREKLSEEAASKLPRPSWILETSPDSFQWGYIFTTPVTDASKIDNLNDGLIASELAPDGKDPGQRGVTRLCRTPGGFNSKASKLVNGLPFKCNLTLWEPHNKVTIEQLAEPFNIDLNVVRREPRVDGASNVPDHPLLHTDVIHIKEMRSPGRYEITCPWVDEHTDQADDGSAIFTNADSLGFKCHHGSCQERTGKDLLEYIETQSPGFNKKLKQWQVMREFTAVTPLQEAVIPQVSTQPTGQSPSNMLRTLCLNGKSKMMESKMLADKFILKDLAILGQWTVFYAGPNTGKTLLTMWLLREAVLTGGLNGDDVFYCNFDDSHPGLVQKLKIAESSGFMMLSDSDDFKAETLISFVKEMIDKDDAAGKVIVLDTLKKFTDLMDKRLSSEFGIIARSFIMNGGSILSLAHVNKHRGADGKSIYAGTSDIRDDADCCYTIEKINESGDIHTVQFINTKDRGDVAQKLSFQYTKMKGAGYQALFDSVKRISKDDVDSTLAAAEAAEQVANDSNVIEHIKTAITNDVISKREIEKFVMDSFGDSRRTVLRVLEEYEGRLWSVDKGLHNKSAYRLNDAPIAPVNFL